MANNYVAKDANGSNVTFESEDIGGGVQRVAHKIMSLLGITSKGSALSANSLPVVIASDQGAVATTDSAVTALSKNNGTMDAQTLRVITASDGPLNTVLGTTSGAAVVTDANGTVQQYLRGLVKQIANYITVNINSGQSVALAAGSAIVGKVGIDQTTPGTTNGVQVNAALPAGENHIGEISGKSIVKDVTFTLDTAQYAAGDVLVVTQEITNFFRVAGGQAVLLGVDILDEDSQSGAFDILLFDSNVNIGTINQPYDITDAEMRQKLGRVVVQAGDYTAWTNQATAFLSPADYGCKARILQAAGGSTSLFIAAISRDTKTYTANGIRLKLQALLS